MRAGAAGTVGGEGARPGAGADSRADFHGGEDGGKTACFRVFFRNSKQGPDVGIAGGGRVWYGAGNGRRWVPEGKKRSS